MAPLSRRRKVNLLTVLGELVQAATGEWPIRVDVVTSNGPDDGKTKRWFVEYETGPYGQVIDDQPDEPV